MTTVALRARVLSWWRSHAATLVPSGQSVSASVVSLIALAISGPLVARELGVAGRGYLALVMVWGFAFALVGTLGVPAAVTYFVAQRPSQGGRILGEIIPIAALQVALVTALTAVVLALLGAGRPAAVQQAARLAPVFIPAGIAHQYALAILQARRRFLIFNICRVLPGTLYAGAVLLLFLIGGGHLLAVVVAWVATSWLAALVASWAALRELRPEWSRTTTVRGDLLRFAVRGYLGSFSAIDQLSLDQAAVAVALPAPSVGLYAVASAFSNLPAFVGWGLGTVLYPLVAAQRRRQNARGLINRFVLSVSLLNVLGIALLAALLPGLVHFFFGVAFMAAVPIARILLLATAIGASWRVLVEGLRGLGHPLVSSVSEAAMYPLLAISAPLLILQWGAIGMAVALVLSRTVSLVVAIVAAAALMANGHATQESGSHEFVAGSGSGAAIELEPVGAIQHSGTRG